MTVVTLMAVMALTTSAATTYLRISAVGAPLVLLALVANGYLRGVRDTNCALFLVLIGGLVLVVLHLTVVISQQSEHITRLAQELAITRSESPAPPADVASARRGERPAARA